MDFVGFGTANEYETAAAKAPSNATSIIRVNNQDTDDNSNDFITTTPNPRNGQISDPGKTGEQDGFTIKHMPITTAARGSDLFIGFETTARTTGNVLVITTSGNMKRYNTGKGTDFHVPIPKEDIDNCLEIQYAIEMTDGTYTRRMPEEGTYKVSIKETVDVEKPSQEIKSIKVAKALGIAQTVTIEGIVLNDYVQKSLGCYILAFWIFNSKIY